MKIQPLTTPTRTFDRSVPRSLAALSTAMSCCEAAAAGPCGDDECSKRKCCYGPAGHPCVPTRAQNVIGSGPTLPPTSEGSTSDLNVRYTYWLQTEARDSSTPVAFYSLQRSVKSVPLRYLVPSSGADVLPYVSGRFFLTEQSNLEGVNANRSFLYGPPPVPSVIADLRPVNRYALNPNYWLTPPDQLFTVFVRDARTGRYFRDPNNRNSEPPAFMLEHRACDGDVGEDEATNLRYVFDSSTCRWYLDDYINAPAFVNTPFNACSLNHVDAADAAGALDYPPTLDLVPNPATFTPAECAQAVERR